MKASEKKEIICVICPLGCTAIVTIEEGRIAKIEGAECARGEDYAIKEIESPERDFFSTVRVRGGKLAVCPVRSNKPIPKEKLMECSQELARTTVDAPVKSGQVIIKDIMGLGTDITATRDLDSAREEERRLQ